MSNDFIYAFEVSFRCPSCGCCHYYPFEMNGDKPNRRFACKKCGHIYHINETFSIEEEIIKKSQIVLLKAIELQPEKTNSE